MPGLPFGEEPGQRHDVGVHLLLDRCRQVIAVLRHGQLWVLGFDESEAFA